MLEASDNAPLKPSFGSHCRLATAYVSVVPMTRSTTSELTAPHLSHGYANTPRTSCGETNKKSCAHSAHWRVCMRLRSKNSQRNTRCEACRNRANCCPRWIVEQYDTA